MGNESGDEWRNLIRRWSDSDGEEVRLLVYGIVGEEFEYDGKR